MFELTGEYMITLPLISAIVLATLVSWALATETVSALKLRRRGVDIDHRPPVDLLAGVAVAHVMEWQP